MAKTKIALIEDDLAIVQMYRMKFEAEGFDVAYAGDGEQGLEMVREFKPDIVLLDLMMPVMDGAEMLAKMRAESWGKDVKVIILTNMGEAEAPKAIRELGVDSFIVKADLTPKQVAERVSRALAA
ncbi:MAG: response regulator [Candidatus Saccharimonadales bacterium]